MVWLLFMLSYPGVKVNLKIFKEGGLRLGWVKVTWIVDRGLNSKQRCSQMVEPAFLMWIS